MKAEYNKLNIHLSKEELAILQGKKGSMMQKVMETVVLYGEALNAEKLIPIEGPGHFDFLFKSWNRAFHKDAGRACCCWS